MPDSDPCPFTAKKIGEIDRSPSWNAIRVGIFEGENQIGEYVRNYSLLNTFCPFQQDGKWYALYSPHYTATRLMSLPDCKDIGGEEPHGFGFCPMEFYVPEITVHEFARGEYLTDPYPYNPRHDPKTWAVQEQKGDYVQNVWPEKGTAKHDEYKAACDKFDAEAKAWNGRHPFVTKYARWGFVGGCVWGDDSSSKVQFLDLDRAAEGIVKRDDRFGYFELPNGIGIKDCIGVDSIDYEFESPYRKIVQIATPIRFTLEGERLSDD